MQNKKPRFRHFCILWTVKLWILWDLTTYTNNTKCFEKQFWHLVLNNKSVFYYTVLNFASFVSELKKTKVDLETLKSQATSTNNEYDRLLKEHEKLQVSWTQYLLNRTKTLMLFFVIFSKVYSDCFELSQWRCYNWLEVFKIFLS